MPDHRSVRDFCIIACARGNADYSDEIPAAMIKDAWLPYCRQKGFVEYHYSNGVGFHASAEHTAIGKRIPWG